MINILKVTLEFTTNECFGDECNGTLDWPAMPSILLDRTFLAWRALPLLPYVVLNMGQNRKSNIRHMNI